MFLFCLVPSMVFNFPVVFTLGCLWFSLVLPMALLPQRLSIAELHAPHELQHVLESLPRE